MPTGVDPGETRAVTIVTVPTTRSHGPIYWFARHLGAMTVAMVAGMAAYGLAVGVVAGLVAGAGTEDVRVDHPELFALGMALAMSAPMVAWMRRRGHSRRSSAEMTAAMVLPAGALVVCYWAHAIAASAICPLACATMLPAMLVAMLARRADYTCRRPA